MMRHPFSDVRQFQLDPLAFLDKAASANPNPLVELKLGLSPVYLVANPDTAKSLLKAAEADIDKGSLVRKLRPVVGDSSLVTSGPEQKRRRSAMHDSLKRNNVDAAVPALTAEIRKTISELAVGGTFSATESMRHLALNLICIALFGHNVLTAGDRTALLDAISIAEAQLEKDMFRPLPHTPWGARAARREYDCAKETLSIIVERVRQKAAGSSSLARLEQLGLSDEDLRDEILTMLIAGHHTTGSAAAWVLYYLAQFPDHAKDLAHEAVSLTDATGEIQAGKLKHASKSYAFVREVLRLKPSIWWFARETQKSVEFDGMKIRKGAALIVSPWQFHQDHRYWDAPEKFDPTRNFSQTAYMPFGAGPRACIGTALALLQMQILALEVAGSIDLTCVSDPADLVPRASITLVPPNIQLNATVGGVSRAEPKAA